MLTENVLDPEEEAGIVPCVTSGPSPLWVPGPQGSDEDNNSFSHAGQASLGLADAYTSVYPPCILDSVAAVFSIRCVLGPHCGLL